MTRIIRAPRDQPRCSQQAVSGERGSGTRVLRSWQVEALAQAERRLDEARTEAEMIMREARTAAQALRVRAEEEAQATAASLLVEARRQALHDLEQNRAALTRLGVAVAEKLLGAELTLAPEQITGVIKRCLREAASARRLVVRVHPADVEATEVAVAAIEGDRERVVEVVGDGEIRRGGCTIDSELGQIDGRLESQLQAILEALEGAT